MGVYGMFGKERLKDMLSNKNRELIDLRHLIYGFDMSLKKR